MKKKGLNEKVRDKLAEKLTSLTNSEGRIRISSMAKAMLEIAFFGSYPKEKIKWSKDKSFKKGFITGFVTGWETFQNNAIAQEQMEDAAKLKHYVG